MVKFLAVVSTYFDDDLKIRKLYKFNEVSKGIKSKSIVFFSVLFFAAGSIRCRLRQQFDQYTEPV